MEITSPNKRIARNTLALYVRMLVNVLVSLYTSRVVLSTLGIEDYGIYGVVAGVVGFFSFINTSQSGATSRFLTFEMGRGDKGRLPETFVSAKIVHIAIALLVLLLAETIGVWFLNNKLVIPDGRMYAARWLLQMSIIIAVINVIQTPYTATIIAHEKMGVYAFVEMLNTFLKLGIVYLLVLLDIDKLILYSILILFVTTLIFLIYRIYCYCFFNETRFHYVWQKDILKSMLSFSGLNMFGNMGSIVNLQGTNYVINMFFGVAYNAAVSVASTVSGAVEGFAMNVLTAFRPQITKDYARADYCSFEKYLDLAVKAILAIYCLIAVPAFIESEKVLAIWLKVVPPCSAVFCRLMLINIFFTTLRYVITIGIHATARVKTISIVTCLVQMINPFLIWFLFKAGMKVEMAFVSIIIINIFLCGVYMILLQKYVQQISCLKITISAILVLVTCIVAMVGTFFIITRFDASFYRILLTIFLADSGIVLGVWLFCLSQNQRQLIRYQVKQLINKQNNKEVK